MRLGEFRDVYYHLMAPQTSYKAWPLQTTCLPAQHCMHASVYSVRRQLWVLHTTPTLCLEWFHHSEWKDVIFWWGLKSTIFKCSNTFREECRSIAAADSSTKPTGPIVKGFFCLKSSGVSVGELLRSGMQQVASLVFHEHPKRCWGGKIPFKHLNSDVCGGNLVHMLLSSSIAC